MNTHLLLLTTGSCFSVRISSYDARGKFGEHERNASVAGGAAESNASFLRALQTSQGHHSSLDIRTAKSMNQMFYNILPMEMYDENPPKI